MTIGRLPAVEGGIQPTIIDAKGDLIAGVTNDTPGRLPVGADGAVLQADSTASTGVSWAGPAFNAGKNKIINGDFYVNQRSFTSTTTTNTYGLDRWRLLASGGTATYSSQTFTPGTAPVAGYEGKNFARIVTSGQSAAGDYGMLNQPIEDVRTLAGQNVTVSFWAKAASGTPKVGISFEQLFGSGGSAGVIVKLTSQTISTSWARYSVTVAMPSLTGKTISTGNDTLLSLELWTSAGTGMASYTDIGIQNTTIDIWGVQVEAGSVATPFTTATGTIQGELAACQRYYQFAFGGVMGRYNNGDYAGAAVNYAVNMRTAPTVTRISDYQLSGFVTPSAENSDTFGFMAISQANTSSDITFRTKYSASAEL